MWKTRSLISVLTVCLGCTVGPKYRKPAISTPALFRDVPEPAPGGDSSSLADLKWFEVFKDEQLQELVRTALVQNYDLRSAVARVSAARANLGTTRANQFPTFTGVGDITTLRNSRNGSLALPATFVPSQNRTFGEALLNLVSFEVDIWGRLRSATESARADLLATEENRKAVITTLVSDVASAYFNLLELDMELAISRKTLSARRDSLELIRVREGGGVATLLEVRQGEQLVLSAEQTIPDLERLVTQTENQISLLLGASPAPVIRVRKLTDEEQPPSTPPGLPSSLLERRPDIRAAEQNLIAANADVRVARTAYFPQVSLTGLLGGQSNQLSELFTGPALAWQFIPKATQPIFNAGRIRSTVRLAEAQQQAALIQYELSIQTAFREVSDSLVQLKRVREVRGKQELLVSTLEDRSRLAYLRYRGGVDTYLNALDSDRDLFQAELTLAQTRRNELLAIVQLYKALGGGWQQ